MKVYHNWFLCVNFKHDFLSIKWRKCYDFGGRNLFFFLYRPQLLRLTPVIRKGIGDLLIRWQFNLCVTLFYLHDMWLLIRGQVKYVCVTLLYLHTINMYCQQRTWCTERQYQCGVSGTFHQIYTQSSPNKWKHASLYLIKR